ncbi:MAG: hypothetical protein GDA42_07825 [Ekhidna sp.]|nr:hypothetical protein [Ekhidna sp.]
MRRCAGLVSIGHWLIFSLICCFPAFCQDIAVGTWRTHFSYRNARIVQITDSKVFCAVEHGFFSRDLTTGETRKLSKIDGLSDVQVTAMAYASSLNILIIGYESGVIDLISDDQIIGIKDIATSNLKRAKRINDIVVSGTNAYIASGFGVVVVNLNSKEITKNFLQIGNGGSDVIVEELVIRNDSLFVLTAEGIQSGKLSDNLLDFNNWTRFSNTSSFDQLSFTSQGLFANDASNLIRYGGGKWTDTGIALPAGSSPLFKVNNKLYTASSNTIYEFNDNGFDVVLNNSAITAINDITISSNGNLLVADGHLGLVDAEANGLSPDGPPSDEFSRVKVIGENMYAFNAPSPDTYNGSQTVEGYSLFSEGLWSDQIIGNFTNISDVTTFNGIEYFTSIGDGLYINGIGIVSDIPNSATSLDTILTGIETGGSLYVSGYGEQSFHTLDVSGRWTSYDGSEVFSNKLDQVLVSRLEVLWLLSSTGSITVFDPDEKLSDLINTSDGLPSSISNFTISVEDNAWIGTSRGPVLFPDASFIFSNAEVVLPTFENRVLFEDEQINAILTDGGNRVWFGTNRGLWVFDKNTSEQLALFNASNSPLPSDVIVKLAYNSRSGEIFIATDKGLVSYRSASSIGTPSHSNVMVFPNPVRPEYQGQVGISGLVNNAAVKITDINGSLVKELRANGGSVSWDLLNANGSRVVTGIYYLFSASTEGEETFIGKIAVIR